jgi:hypothetical protein
MAHAPFQCEACSGVLPNASSILMNDEERILYHKEGRTRIVDRYLFKSPRWKVSRKTEFSDTPDEYIYRCVSGM